MEVRMSSGVVTSSVLYRGESLDSQHHTKDAILQAKESAEKELKALRCRLTLPRHQVTVVLKEFAKGDRDAEDVLTMEKWVENKQLGACPRMPFLPNSSEFQKNNARNIRHMAALIF
jgi:hypothetical protein